ncbi:ATP-dependent endonuclease, partial [Ancylomarina sp. 16SWW S1-10-2]
GSHSSNVGLSNWFGMNGYSDLEDIRSKDDSTKVSGCRRLAFQVNEDESDLCGRSFEDAFILANISLFELKDLKGLELENAVFERAKEIGKDSKANFAIEYAIEKTDWAVPKYIVEGLEWLDKDVLVKVEEAQP